MKPKKSLSAITFGALAVCTLSAHAGLATAAEIESEIFEYLSRKGEITRFELIEAREKCIPMRGRLTTDTDFYSYGADLSSKTTQNKLSYLICVQVESDGTFAIEYLPEGWHAGSQ